MKKRKPLWLKILLAIVFLGLAACLWEFISSQNPYILPIKRALKYEVLGMTTADQARETAGLNADTLRCSIHENGQRPDGVPAPDTDCKLIYDDGNMTRLVNYTDGYQLDLPANTIFDFSLSPLYVTGYGEGFDVTISREKADYQSIKDVITFELSTFLPGIFKDTTVRDYVLHYEYRFLLDEGWQQNNGVTAAARTEGNFLFVEAQADSFPDNAFDGYLYVTCFTPSREYLRVMYRYDREDAATRDSLLALAGNTLLFDPLGTAQYDTDYAPVTRQPGELSPETQALYDSLYDFDAPMQWGIFMQDFYESGFDNKLVEMEQALDYTFPLILYYRHFPTHPFPTEVMQENYEAGRLVELTLQLTDNNNMDMFATSPLLEIYRGNMDAELRRWARDAKAFGHPFLFRLNNEMNSDWTSYGGVVNLADPQIFTAVWQRIYRIFEEEGVDNCLWIFNPHDRQAPPSDWNNSLAYYPGSEYVHLIGVTGYNNGTYYTKWAEEWREFDVIYDQIWDEYYPRFGQFPWIITEFASSGIGGDKVAWMDNMFAHIHDYPNIRMAVWFSFADFDDSNGGTPARTYWLDETPETLEAFRRGLQAQFAN
ncbi:MAG: hypothetical protein IJA11_04020 [Oscillospiraceae bacterium]|nr:hypothetical protein [Oscillospiraceae bacterium]